MAIQLTADDLQFKYSKTATPGDDPLLIKLDRAFLNKSEEYEVLDFINAFVKNHTIAGKPMTKEHGKKVEMMIQKKPSEIRSRANVTEWIKTNWSRYS